uniref:Shugoshin C-terminal domain-containing protein n=1 Tax=Salix viminalis TaxID=40686 RepID=A0A6N2KQS5_SALVM
MKGERMAKRASFGNIMRRRLSDITNTQAQPKLVGLVEEQPQISESNEDLINQLLQEKQEKEMLLKLVEERNKIIELSGNKLRDLRMNYQKLQAQNWNLAQSNSQMLAELNLGREKLKALQHEIVCKEALLKAKNLRPQGNADMNCQNVVSQEVEKTEEEEYAANNDIKPCSRSRRRTGRSRSMGPSTTNRQKEKAESKRRCVRRQSATRSQEREPAENLFEIEDVKFPVSNSRDKSMKENGLTPPSSITKEEICEPRNEAQGSHRSSIGRPSRKAAEKVQSYKEVPINVKMRRAE